MTMISIIIKLIILNLLTLNISFNFIFSVSPSYKFNLNLLLILNNCFIIKSNDKKEWMEKINLIVKDAKLRKKFGIMSRDLALRMSWEKVFDELFRVTQHNGYVAFEVGEIRNGKVKLEENVSIFLKPI